jgi:hypothetical protein
VGSCPMCQVIEGITHGATEASRALDTPVSVQHMIRGGITIGMTYEKHGRFTDGDRFRFCHECHVTLAMAESAIGLLPKKDTS